MPRKPKRGRPVGSDYPARYAFRCTAEMADALTDLGPTWVRATVRVALAKEIRARRIAADEKRGKGT